MGMNGSSSAAEQIDRVARVINRAGQELARQQPSVSNYAARIAEGIGTLADRLRDARVDELVDEARDLARRNPGLFLLGSVAIGFALSRVLKASVRRPATYEADDISYGDGYGDSAPTDGSAPHTTRRVL
jgi:hypothetical protein